MQTYYQLDCPVLEQIQKETLDYIQTKTNLLEHVDQFWNKINNVEFIKRSPTLVNYCCSIDLKLREIAILVADSTVDVTLHIDEKPLTAKINFPILNTKNTYTEWYDIPTTVLDNINAVTNSFNTSYYDLRNLDLTKYNKIAEFEMLAPVVFNSQIPHRVRISPTAKFPRIVLACMFFDEPIDYLL